MIRIFALYALLATTQIYGGTASPETQFELRDPKTKEIYFTGREKTSQDGEAIRKETLYFDSNKKEVLKDSFAFDAKTLRAIDFISSNAITGEEIKVSGQDQGLDIQYRPSHDGKTGTNTVKSEKQIYLPSIAGDLILQNWDNLMTGKAVKFDLVIASRMETIPFQLVRREALTVDNEEREVFTLMPQNFLIRMLAPHLEFQYGKDKKIRQALFPSPLPIHGGQNQMVEMVFRPNDAKLSN